MTIFARRSLSPIRLTLNAAPTFDGARETAFNPVTEERSLRSNGPVYYILSGVGFGDVTTLS